MISIRPARLLIACALGLAAVLGGSPVAAGGLPTGETQLGQSLIEPAYNDTTGTIVYLLTPLKSPFPAHTSSHAVAPLYLVEYPPSYPGWTLNCMGVPGNCPDHDFGVAAFATGHQHDVYGSDPYAVPGHDHLVGLASSHQDFNVAWEVVEVLFTNAAAANNHLTTDAAVESAIASGDAIAYDLGFSFTCSVVSVVAYNKGTPIG
jgi:hypothetical protein